MKISSYNITNSFDKKVKQKSNQLNHNFKFYLNELAKKDLSTTNSNMRVDPNGKPYEFYPIISAEEIREVVNSLKVTNGNDEEIAKIIDVTNCSRKEIYGLRQYLFESGKITEKEYHNLDGMISVRDFDAGIFTGSIQKGTLDFCHPTSNGNRNWIACFKDQLKLERESNHGVLNTSSRVVNIIQNISNKFPTQFS